VSRNRGAWSDLGGSGSRSSHTFPCTPMESGFRRCGNAASKGEDRGEGDRSRRLTQPAAVRPHPAHLWRADLSLLRWLSWSQPSSRSTGTSAFASDEVPLRRTKASAERARCSAASRASQRRIIATSQSSIAARLVRPCRIPERLPGQGRWRRHAGRSSLRRPAPAWASEAEVALRDRDAL